MGHNGVEFSQRILLQIWRKDCETSKRFTMIQIINRATNVLHSFISKKIDCGCRTTSGQLFDEISSGIYKKSMSQV